MNYPYKDNTAEKIPQTLLSPQNRRALLNFLESFEPPNLVPYDIHENLFVLNGTCMSMSPSLNDFPILLCYPCYFIPWGLYSMSTRW